MYIALRSTGLEYLVVASHSHELGALMLLADGLSLETPDHSELCGYSPKAWIGSPDTLAFVTRSRSGTEAWSVWWLPRPEHLERPAAPVVSRQTDIGRNTLSTSLGDYNLGLDLPINEPWSIEAYDIDDKLPDDLAYAKIYHWLAFVARAQKINSKAAQLLVPTDPHQKPGWDQIDRTWLAQVRAILQVTQDSVRGTME